MSPSGGMVLMFLVPCILSSGVHGSDDSPGRCEPYVGSLCGGTVTYDVYLAGQNEGDELYEDFESKEVVLQVNEL